MRLFSYSAGFSPATPTETPAPSSVVSTVSYDDESIAPQSPTIDQECGSQATPTQQAFVQVDSQDDDDEAGKEAIGPKAQVQ